MRNRDPGLRTAAPHPLGPQSRVRDERVSGPETGKGEARGCQRLRPRYTAPNAEVTSSGGGCLFLYLAPRRGGPGSGAGAGRGKGKHGEVEFYERH